MNLPRMRDIRLEEVLRALGDPVRLSVVQQLLRSPAQELACGSFVHSVTKPTFSHHMKILRDAGLTRTRHEGTRRMVSLRMDELERKFPGLLDLLSSAK